MSVPLPSPPPPLPLAISEANRRTQKNTLIPQCPFNPTLVISKPPSFTETTHYYTAGPETPTQACGSFCGRWRQAVPSTGDKQYQALAASSANHPPAACTSHLRFFQFRVHNDPTQAHTIQPGGTVHDPAIEADERKQTEAERQMRQQRQLRQRGR